MKTVRATMTSSVTAGIVFGVLVVFFDGLGTMAQLFLTAVLIALFIVFVAGIPHLRAMSQERKRRRLRAGWMVEKKDFQEFYFPVWRRMLGWFGGAIASTVITKLVLELCAG